MLEYNYVVLTLTWQLSSPAAHTAGAVLQTIVSFKPARPLSPEIALALPLTAVYATWHAEAVVQTLQPTPPHPLSQVQLDAVKFAKPGDDADG
jgi:hypothetical protein